MCKRIFDHFSMKGSKVTGSTEIAQPPSKTDVNPALDFARFCKAMS